MMSWILLCSLTAVTFFNRYLFLEPKTAIKLPDFTLRMLKYAAPCLMVSISTPIVFFEHGEWKGIISNSYFYGAIFAVFVTAITRKMLISIALSLLFFYVMIYFFDF